MSLQDSISPTDHAFPGDNIDNLPYPAPLSRSDFLDPDFDPQRYLGSLQDRRQSLEDLRAELRDCSRRLNAELVDLVNANSQDFLTVGARLTGGGDRMEHIGLSLLAFQKRIEQVREEVLQRKRDAAALVREREHVLRQIQQGRRMLDFGRQVRRLERKLMIKAGPVQQTAPSDDEGSDNDSSDYEEGDDSPPLESMAVRLDQHVLSYLAIKAIAKDLGDSLPFLASYSTRLARIRTTLLLDLSSTIRQARKEGSNMVLTLFNLYSTMGEAAEGLSILKSGI